MRGIIDFVQNSNFRFKDKIKIISNQQRLGAVANLYFWINKYCGEQEIVINPDADDALIGSQALKVINAVYLNPEIWFSYSKFIAENFVSDN